MLNVQLPWLDEIVAAKDGRRLPVVLTPGEVRNLLNEVNGTMGLMGSLLYGTGTRVLARRVPASRLRFQSQVREDTLDHRPPPGRREANQHA